MSFRVCVIALLLASGLLAAEPTALPEWDAAASVVVVYNTEYPESRNLAEYYAAKRNIAADSIVGLPCSQTEAMTREAFDEQLRLPLKKIFADHHWWEPATRKFLVVLMHGVPSKINRQNKNAKPSQEDEASVDSELALLGAPPARLTGALPNPYFGKKERFNQFGKSQGMVLVCRLDAASPATVRRMIDDSVAVEQTGLLGRGVIDLALKKGAYDEGEEWLRKSARTYRTNGIPVYVDRYEPVLRDEWPLPDTALYFGWYTGQVAGAIKSPSFRFKQGAVACHLHSFSASTIRTTTDAWVGPILEHGAAATMGNVVLGDPLYRPFKESSMGTGSDVDYSLYKAVVKRHASEKEEKALKDDLLQLAVKHDSPRLLELLALLSSLEGKVDEALEVIEHAQALVTAPADRLRLVLYAVEMLRRDREKAKDEAAFKLLQKAAVDEALNSLPGSSAIGSLLKEMGR